MALSLLDQSRAIVWAQFRTLVNFYPRADKLTAGASFCLTAIWYGGWVAGAAAFGAALARRSDLRSGEVVLTYAFLGAFFYWQIVPLMLVTAGVSLEVKKLIVYPIPHAQLFLLDVILRVSTGVEVLIMITGAAFGILFNPRLPWWSALAFLPFIVFNLSFAAGVRELMVRVMAKRFLREISILLLVMIGALPQFFLLAGDRLKGTAAGRAMPRLIEIEHAISAFLPWTATAEWAMGRLTLRGFLVIIGWAAAAILFGRSQFERGLRFDAAAVQTAPIQNVAPPRWSEWIFTWPSRIFSDPLAAMIEKEFRSLVRAPRFRLVFFMGFSFGLLVWLPMLMKSSETTGFFHDNYLTFVAVYALLLLGDVCLWNVFGFDRSAAQAYLVTPVKLRSAFIAKNVVALTFVLLDVTGVAIVCLSLRLPLPFAKAVPAYLISILMTFTLMSAGNLTSVYYPRPVNPRKSLRSSPGARTQGLLMLIFVVASAMSGLAYLAEYAFDSLLAFYGVLAVLGVVVGILYRIALDSAVEAAYARREQFIAALSQTEAPVVA